MKIKELIEILKKLPQNDEIEYWDWERQVWFWVDKVEAMKCLYTGWNLPSSYEYFTAEEEKDMNKEIKKLSEKWKDFKLLHKRVIK